MPCRGEGVALMSVQSTTSGAVEGTRLRLVSLLRFVSLWCGSCRQAAMDLDECLSHAMSPGTEAGMCDADRGPRKRGRARQAAPQWGDSLTHCGRLLSRGNAVELAARARNQRALAARRCLHGGTWQKPRHPTPPVRRRGWQDALSRRRGRVSGGRNTPTEPSVLESPARRGAGRTERTAVWRKCARRAATSMPHIEVSPRR